MMILWPVLKLCWILDAEQAMTLSGGLQEPLEMKFLSL
jgi:hypothetical protein